MKIKREDFIEVLERVQPALATSGSMTALLHIWFDGKYIYAYNGALGIRVAWATKLEPCGLPGSVLMGLLRSSSAEEASLEHIDDTHLEVKLGRASAKISALLPDNNPWPFPARTPSGLSIGLTEELLEGLKLAQVIKAKTPRRVEHYGVILFPGKEGVVLYSTDSKAMAEIPVKSKFDKAMAKTVLPHGFISQLLKLEPGGRISISKDALIAEADDLQICSNVLDNSGVWDLPKLIGTRLSGTEKRSPVPEGLMEGLKRAVILAGSNEEALINLSVARKELELSGKWNSATLNERLPLKGTAEGKMVVVLESLKALVQGAEEFAFAKSALALYGRNNARYLVAMHE